MRSIYDEILLTHNLHPAHRGDLLGAEDAKRLVNASCGDELLVLVERDADDKVKNVVWDGHGCAIALASADLMAEVLMGKKWSEALALFDLLPALLRGELNAEQIEQFGEAAALSTVARMPARQACAKLAWRVLE
ncbi:SUF system NifU family Fe-S cluster assembly protein [Candidatus Saccharibacteria bacterium]|nr:SUF system NifU family Fe-S cluster assembly protein [Candidatus Saccharibacteria bacterium]